MNTPVIMSYGLGVDSTAILLRWLREPSSRDFDLSDLTLVTAMTGDEWGHTKRDVETHILPLLREHQIRFVQVARSRRYVTKGGGVTVLSDTDQPRELHLAGGYRLSEEMHEAGTVPQSGGDRICSVHAKGDVLDPTIARITDGRLYRHVIGYEANEQKRRLKDSKYDTALRGGEYPLIEWGWDRQACLDYIQAELGMQWQKSACVYCPFSMQNKVSLVRQLELYREHPDAAAQALFMEHVALSLNPKQNLLNRKALSTVLAEAGLDEGFRLLTVRLNETEHALYDVRRILRPRVEDPTKLANADRSVRRITTGTRADMIDAIRRHGGHLQDGFWRLPIRERAETLPTVEHFIAVAPAVVLDKQKDQFEKWWGDIAETELAA